MKNLICFILITLIAAMTYSCTESTTTELQGEDVVLTTRDITIGESCLGETPNPCDTLVYSWQIALDDYPGCIFEVSVEGYVCHSVGVSAFHLGDFMLESDLGCPAFDNDLANAISNGTEEQFIVNINQEVWRTVTSNIINGGTVSQTTTVLEIEYVIGSCKYLCLFDELDCDNTCCRKINTYQRVNGRWELTKEGETYTEVGECPISPATLCDPNVLQSASCYDNCASLDF